MKASIVLGIACVGSYVTGSAAFNFFGNDQDSKFTQVEHPQAPPFKLDYKLSFKKPYYYNNNTIPFWTTSGDVIKAADFIRLAPSVPGSKGHIWSTIPNPYEEWEVNFQMKIVGQHVGGGRGMAFWYARDTHQDGPIFGSKDNWNGLGIWFDSSSPKTKSPMTLALVNDGTKGFASKVDPTRHMLGSCFHNYRNTEEPVFVKITYKNRTLSVMMDSDNRGSSYHFCLRKQNVDLPTGYHFGLTAASQSPPDDHDVITFETWQLNPPAKLSHPNRPLEEEKIKKGQKFEGLDEEQKQKIEDISYKIKLLQELAGEKEPAPADQSLISMGAILDQQHRLMEKLTAIQLQLIALGAPDQEQLNSADSVGKPNSQSKTFVNKNERSESENRAANNGPSQALLEQLNRRSRDQDSQVQNILSAIGRLENGIRSMENLQAEHTSKIASFTAKPQSKGSSTVMNVIAYFFIAQVVAFAAAYGYYKFRIQQNAKKFM